MSYRTLTGMVHYGEALYDKVTIVVMGLVVFAKLFIDSSSQKE
jgi:hypothetical protein